MNHSPSTVGEKRRARVVARLVKAELKLHKAMSSCSVCSEHIYNLEQRVHKLERAFYVTFQESLAFDDSVPSVSPQLRD